MKISNQTTIIRNEATEKNKISEASKKESNKIYTKNIDNARRDLYNSLANENFRFSDFEEIAVSNNIDTDDLFHLMI